MPTNGGTPLGSQSRYSPRSTTFPIIMGAPLLDRNHAIRPVQPRFLLSWAWFQITLSWGWSQITGVFFHSNIVKDWTIASVLTTCPHFTIFVKTDAILCFTNVEQAGVPGHTQLHSSVRRVRRMCPAIFHIFSPYFRLYEVLSLHVCFLPYKYRKIM